MREQSEWNAYDRKKCKKVRYVFHKASHKLTKQDRMYLERFFELSPELKTAYGLKENFYEWFNEAKRRGPGHIEKTREASLHTFYEKLEESRIPEFMKNT